MRSLLFLILTLLFSVTTSYSQKKVEPLNYPSPFAFTLTDSTSLTKQDAYLKLNEWIAKSYGDSKAVIQLQDKEAGKIVGKGIIDLPQSKVMAKYKTTYGGNVDYAITIDVKDNKYRIVLDNFFHQPGKLDMGMYGTDVIEGYGSLDLPFAPIKDPATHTIKRSREYRYNEIKNYCLQYAQKTLSDIQTFMKSSAKTGDF